MLLLSSSHKVIFVDDSCHGMVDLVDFKIESAASCAGSKSIIGLVLISFHFIETLSGLSAEAVCCDEMVLFICICIAAD